MKLKKGDKPILLWKYANELTIGVLLWKYANELTLGHSELQQFGSAGCQSCTTQTKGYSN